MVASLDCSVADVFLSVWAGATRQIDFQRMRRLLAFVHRRKRKGIALTIFRLPNYIFICFLVMFSVAYKFTVSVKGLRIISELKQRMVRALLHQWTYRIG